MSVTVTSLSVGLLTQFISIAITNSLRLGESISNVMLEDKSSIKEANYLNNEETIQSLCRKYETVFLDKNLLIKTIDEYGFSDINIQENLITATLDAFFVKFERETNDKAFVMSISVSDNCDDVELFNDLSVEYSSNCQEETYFKIKERAANKNLEIIEEEVLDDETIVLTISLD